MSKGKYMCTTYHTPLFAQAYKALPNSSPNPTKYLLLKSPLLKSTIYQNKNICPAFETQNQQSLLQLNGICLQDYLKSKHNSQCALSEDEIWNLIFNLINAFLTVQANQCTISHLKEYSIRKVSQNNFQLLYHHTMTNQLQLAKGQKYSWDNFYLSPEQLNGQFIKEKSIVFSLGVLILNICSYQDQNRKIYRPDKYEVDWIRIQEKFKIVNHYYSKELSQVIAQCLQFSYQHRYNFQELRCFCQRKLDKIQKKKTNVLQKIIEMSDSSQVQYDLILPKVQKSKPKNQISTPKKKKKMQKIIINSSDKEKSKTIETTKNQKQVKNKHDTLKENIKEFDYRGTFGQRYEPQEVREVPKKKQEHQQMRQEKQDDKNKKPALQIGNLNNYQKYFPEEVNQNSQHPQTPKGFNTQNIEEKKKFLFKRAYSQQSQNLQQPPLIERQTFGVNQPIDVPPRITSLKELKLYFCLLPLEELKNSVGGPGVYIDGDLYFGQFLNGRRHGLGLQIFQNGQYYYGFFNQDLFNGQGFYFWNQSQYFFGNFELGQKIWGRLQGPTKYQGGFKNNRRHGKGTCWYQSGQIYIGEWVNGKKHNEGTIKQPSGNKFVGKWDKGKRFGEGCLETDYLRIAGFWKGEQIVGQALIQYKNGDVFRGGLGPDLQKVQGEYISKSGRIFRGQYENDEPRKGELIYSNGQKYIGTLKEMRRDGYGEYYYNTGKCYKGYWKMNERIDAN